MTGSTWCGHWLKVLDVKCWSSHIFILGMFSSVGLNGKKGGGAGGAARRKQSQGASSVLAAAMQRLQDGLSLDPGSGKCSLMILRSHMASQLM